MTEVRVPNAEAADKSTWHDVSLWLLRLLRRRAASPFTVRFRVGVSNVAEDMSAKRSRWLCTASTEINDITTYGKYGREKLQRSLMHNYDKINSLKTLRKAYDTSQSFLAKVTFESHFRKKTFRCGIHTCASFYLRKLTFRNRTSSIPASFLSQTVSCDWPVRNTTLLTGVSWS